MSDKRDNDEKSAETSFAGLASFSTMPPPSDDVHNASTQLGTVPAALLEHLKQIAEASPPSVGHHEPEVDVDVTPTTIPPALEAMPVATETRSEPPTNGETPTAPHTTDTSLVRAFEAALYGLEAPADGSREGATPVSLPVVAQVEHEELSVEAAEPAEAPAPPTAAPDAVSAPRAKRSRALVTLAVFISLSFILVAIAFVRREMLGR